MSDEYYTLDLISDEESFVEKDGHRMFMVDVVKDLNYWKRKKEELQAENAELKKQSQWISVEDELPSIDSDAVEYEDYIVRCSNNPKHEDITITLSFTENGWWDGGVEIWNEFVTHWMPLPTPPEGE